MKMRDLFAVTGMTVMCAALAACEPTQTEAQQMGAESDTEKMAEQAASDLSGAEVPVQGKRQIDWVAAKQARIEAIDAGHSASDQVLAQAAGAGSGSAVPVMLPSGIVVPANERQMVAMTEDGYFAAYPGAKYDIIVNGTNEVFSTSSNGDTPEERAFKFTEMEAGAQIAFTRFGADYLVEFECNIIDGSANCITEEEAINVAEGLFVALAE